MFPNIDDLLAVRIITTSRCYAMLVLSLPAFGSMFCAIEKPDDNDAKKRSIATA